MASDEKIKYIEGLLEKYYEANTTLKEEKILSDFFNSEQVPPHLMYDQLQFSYYRQEGGERSQREFKIPEEKRESSAGKFRMLRFINYAAAAILLLSIGWYSNNKYQEHLNEKKEISLAYEETQKAFNLLAANFNKGVEKAELLGEMNKTQKHIIEKDY